MSANAKNIVIFGESGVGKSSVVNLMAGKDVARTSPDMLRCTLHWQEYSMTFGGHDYKVFDTVGLEEPQLGMDKYREVIENACKLIKKLQAEGGIDLLLFCVRARRVTSTMEVNYKLFYECLCEGNVPILLVTTGLEREQRMEDWWTRNEDAFRRYKIDVDGHACITAADKLDGRQRQLYEESRHLVRNLVFKHARRGGVACEGDNGWEGGEGWLGRFMRVLQQQTLRHGSEGCKTVG